jgi:hypothetical protein
MATLKIRSTPRPASDEEAFSTLVTDITAICAEINTRPTQRVKLEVSVQAADDEGRPLVAYVLPQMHSAPWAILRRSSVRVPNGWLLDVLKRDSRTAARFRDYR